MAEQFAYFDTSVLVKRYVREAGSKRAAELLRRYRFLSSAIISLEALSAVSRRKAAGELSERSFEAILSRMQSDRQHWARVELSEPVLSRGEAIIDKATLRTLDSLHIASALVFQDLSGLHVPFITADERQREGAQLAGLHVTWVAPV